MKKKIESNCCNTTVTKRPLKNQRKETVSKHFLASETRSTQEERKLLSSSVIIHTHYYVLSFSPCSVY